MNRCNCIGLVPGVHGNSDVGARKIVRGPRLEVRKAYAKTATKPAKKSISVASRRRDEQKWMAELKQGPTLLEECLSDQKKVRQEQERGKAQTNTGWEQITPGGLRSVRRQGARLAS